MLEVSVQLDHDIVVLFSKGGGLVVVPVVLKVLLDLFHDVLVDGVVIVEVLDNSKEDMQLLRIAFVVHYSFAMVNLNNKLLHEVREDEDSKEQHHGSYHSLWV